MIIEAMKEFAIVLVISNIVVTTLFAFIVTTCWLFK